MTVHAACVSPITQLDGNDTITSENEMLLSARSRAGTTSHSLQQDLCFDFQLNEQNQSKRLVENAQKTAFSVSYKDTRNLNGKTLPTSASIECNAGVYVTAIKPALEAILEG